MNQKDDRVVNLENEAQERIKRIAELRAQISNLRRDEEKMLAEHNDLSARIAAHRERSEELSQLKEEEATLILDIKQREEKHSGLIAELDRLREVRQQLLPQIAQLRAKVSNEETDTKKDAEELTRLKNILAHNETRRKEILDATELQGKTEAELKMLDEQYKDIAERVPLTRNKYEETKKLVETMENNIIPINQSIMDIWQKLPPDVLDVKLVILQKKH